MSALQRAFIQVDNARDAAYTALVEHLNVWAMDLTQNHYQRSAVELEPTGLVVHSASGTSYCLEIDGSYHLCEICEISDAWNALMHHFHEVMGHQNPRDFRFEKRDCFKIKGPRHPR